MHALAQACLKARFPDDFDFQWMSCLLSLLEES